MVLESLINPIKAEKKPWELFFVGIIYASFAIFSSFLVFRDYVSFTAIFLTVLTSIPLIYGAIKIEEKKTLAIKDEKILIKEHGKALSFFVFLFLGFVAAYVMWYVFLPFELTSALFEVQHETLRTINGPVTGSAINLGSAVGTIFLNNMRVLLFCLLFAFFYGSGAIFILVWNASIISAAIGDYIRSSVGASFIGTVINGVFGYLIHGVPEILAYFIGGLAGGIISIAVIRHDFGTDKFRHIVRDSVDMIILSVGILFIAALLEVFISPIF